MFATFHRGIISFGPGAESDYGMDIRIIERVGRPLCSFAMMGFGFGTGLIVCEVNEAIPFGAFSAMLVFLREEAVRREKPYIRFNLHPESTPAEMLKALGASVRPGWAWQMKIVRAERFLMKIAPVINRRLAGSAFRESTLEFGVNLYRDSYRMTLEKGTLVSVEHSSGGMRARRLGERGPVSPARARNEKLARAQLYPARGLSLHGHGGTVDRCAFPAQQVLDTSPVLRALCLKCRTFRML